MEIYMENLTRCYRLAYYYNYNFEIYFLSQKIYLFIEFRFVYPKVGYEIPTINNTALK